MRFGYRHVAMILLLCGCMMSPLLAFAQPPASREQGAIAGIPLEGEYENDAQQRIRLRLEGATFRAYWVEADPECREQLYLTGTITREFARGTQFACTGGRRLPVTIRIKEDGSLLEFYGWGNSGAIEKLTYRKISDPATRP